jgi:hypothetical protein
LICPAVRPPHWRWLRAADLAANPARRPARANDRPTRRSAAFIRARTTGGSPGPADAPLAAAVGLYEENGPTRWRLEATVLTGMPTAAVARKLGLGLPVVRAYEAMFFDVRARLSAAGWVADHTFGLGPHLGFGPDDLGPLWAWVGYTRGEHALDRVVAVTTGSGRGEYPGEELEAAELLVAVAQLSVVREPERVLQLQLRLRAEAVGAHPSAYHLPRTRRRAPGDRGEPADPPARDPARERVGERAPASHN